MSLCCPSSKKVAPRVDERPQQVDAAADSLGARSEHGDAPRRGRSRP
ncbi:hypothetical protein ACFOPN_02575 [Xanthomonas hyacinthi]